MDDDNSLIEYPMQIHRELCSRVIKYDLKQLFRQLKEESINKTMNNLIREIVRIESLCFNEPFFDEEDLVSFNIPKLLNYYKMCQAEMSAMNYHKFEGASTTYFDVLKEPRADQLLSFASDERIAKEFKTKNYENLYPIYASKLAKRFTEVPNKPMTLKEKTRDDFKFIELAKRLGIGLDWDYERYGSPLSSFIKRLERFMPTVEIYLMNQLFVQKEPVVSKKLNISNYYSKCHDELMAMENRKFEGTSIAYIDLLKKPVDLLARYVRNDELVQEFTTKKYKTLFPIYKSKLKIKFNKACARRMLIENVSTALSEILQFDAPDHIFEKIIEYLSKQEMDFLVNCTKI